MHLGWFQGRTIPGRIEKTVSSKLSITFRRKTGILYNALRALHHWVPAHLLPLPCFRPTRGWSPPFSVLILHISAQKTLLSFHFVFPASLRYWHTSYVSLGCTKWWFHTLLCICEKMITILKLVNIPIPSKNYHFWCGDNILDILSWQVHTTVLITVPRWTLDPQNL